MTTKPTVYEALQAVSQDVGAIAKDQRNQQQGFAYRGIDDVLNGIHGPLATHGVAFVPHAVNILSETERATRSGSLQTYLRAAVTYRIYGPAGDHFDSTVLAEASDMGDKASSKLMSMAFKYLAFQVLSIPLAGMEDGDAHTPEERVVAKPAEPRTKDQLHQALAAAIASLGSDLETVTAKFRHTHGGITVDEFLALDAKQISSFVGEVAAYAAKHPKAG